MEPFIGQIMLFGGNFAPRNWEFCDGQLIAISSNSALFSILGTVYGGDGRTTFGLPDLRGRAPIHAGNGPGLTPRRPGEKIGEESVTLSTAQMPSHTHGMSVTRAPADSSRATHQNLASGSFYSATSSPLLELAGSTISDAGGGQAHDNMQPSLAINYIIAMQGDYPPRN